MPAPDTRGHYDYGNTWEQSRTLVLDRLSRASEKLDDIGKAMTRLEIDMAIMRTKVTLFASLAGTIGGLAASLVIMLLTRYIVGH